jgi:hypothetical protein
LTGIINPTLGKTPYHITDSENLKGKLKDITIPSMHRMVSFDITNMYTKIPTDEAIQAIRSYLLNDPPFGERTKMPVDTIIELLQMTLSMAHFLWRGTYHEQTTWLPMGASTSGPSANAYMQPYEKGAVTEYNDTNPGDSGRHAPVLVQTGR